MPTTRHKVIGNKFKLIIGLSLTGLTVTLLMFFYGLTNKLTEEQVKKVKYTSSLGIAQIEYFLKKAEAGELPLIEAQQLALKQLEAQSFGTYGYYWITTSKALMIMHPHEKHKVGRYLMTAEDYRGKSFRQFIDAALNGGGIVRFHWHKPDSKKIYEKIVYVDYVKEWDWILGTGIYLDDAEKDATNSALKSLVVIAFFSLILSGSVILLIYSLAKKLKSQSIRDPQSGLYARTVLQGIEQDLQLQLARDNENFISILYLEVQNFKAFKNECNYKQLNNMIRFIGSTINQLIDTKDIAVRYGDSEFIVITISKNKSTSHKLAQQIKERTSKNVFCDNLKESAIHLHSEITFYSDQDSIEESIKQARNS